MSSFKCIICGIISATLFGISGILASILFRQATVAPEWLVGVRMLCAGAILLCVLTFFTKEAVFSFWRHKNTAFLIILFGLFGVLLAQSSFFFVGLLWGCSHSNSVAITRTGDHCCVDEYI